MSRRNILLCAVACLITRNAASATSVATPRDGAGRALVGERGQRLVYPDGFGPYEPVPSVTPRRATMPAPAAFDPDFLRDDGAIGSFNQNLGVAGIHVVDVDGDGLPEILVGHSMMWYLVGYEPGRDDYVQRYFFETGQGSTFGGGGLVRVAPADIDGDGVLEVVTLRNDGTLEAYTASTGAFVGSFDTGRSAPRTMVCADLYDSAAAEILVLWSDEVRVLSFGDPSPLWVLPTVGARSLAVGQMDLDLGFEVAIATGTGNPGMVFDADLRTVQWSFSTGFGDLVAAGDVDGDGRDEVVGAETWRQVMVVDVDDRLQKWAIGNFNTSAIATGDTDGDGIAEVLVGDAQWGEVRVLDGLSGFELAAVDNPEHSVAANVIGDVDGDCAIDVIWGAGYTSTGEDRLFVADLATRAITWENIENDGPMHAFAVADLDADGRTEILRAGSESDAGYDGALVFVTDHHHRRDLWLPPGPTNDGAMVTRGMAVADIDGDPALEYVMNDSRTYRGKVSAFDGATHMRQWTSLVFDGEYISSIAVGDPDKDNQLDFLIGTGRYHTGALGSFLRILRGSDGALLWRSPALPSDWSGVGDIRVHDVDRDSTNEIVFLKFDNGLRVLDGVTHVEEWFLPGSWTALDVADIDRNGSPSILVGDDTGRLTAYDGETHAMEFQVTVGSDAVVAVRVGDVDRDNTNEILLTLAPSSGPSVLQIRNATADTLLWSSPPLVGRAGDASSLVLADVDDDGALEVVVSTSYALRIFEYAGPVDTTPPTFPGSIGLASAVQTTADGCCNAVDLAWEEADDDASPPVEYRVYRDVAPGFPPGPATLLTQTGQPTYRDVTVRPGTTYHYVVRAVDRLGNEEANLVEQSVAVAGTTDPAPPDQGNVLRAVRTGVDVDLTFPGATGTVWRMFRDRDRTQFGIGVIRPDLVTRSYLDVGAMSASADFYYNLRGVSPCGYTGP